MSNTIRMIIVLLSLVASERVAGTEAFDHGYTAYAQVLSRHVRPPRVDYHSLEQDRGLFDGVVNAFDSSEAQDESHWTREQRMAFWINAYNVFTLRLIIDHYPIQSGWLTLQPRNSIRQIDGAWTERRWRAAGRTVSLDDIEHQILRPTFRDARIHFAVNCASVSCPPLAAAPYRAETLGEQMDDAARRYLGSREGLQVDGNTLRVSSIFKWYGDDFVAGYATLVPGSRDVKERAILGAILTFGPPDAATLAPTGTARVQFLGYDWSLNDVQSAK